MMNKIPPVHIPSITGIAKHVHTLANILNVAKNCAYNYNIYT